MVLGTPGSDGRDPGTDPPGTAVSETTDAPANDSTSYLLTPGGSFSGSIDSATDEDWIAITLETGFDYIVWLRHSRDTPPAEGMKLDLIRPDLAFPRAEDAAAAGDVARFIYNVDFTGGAPGKHYLSVQGTATFDYQLSVQLDIGQSLNTRGTLAVGATETDAIDIELDRDWFSSDLMAGASYTYLLRPTDEIGADDRLALELRDATGATVDRGTTFGSGLVILSYDPGADGTFFIEAEVGTGSYLGGYTLELIDEVAASAATTASLAVGERYDGAYEFLGDTDWVAIDLVAGQNYDLSLAITEAEGDALPRLRLLDPSGGFLAETGNIETPADGTLTYAAMTTGRFYLEVSASASSLVGGYRLTAAEVTETGPITGTPGDDVLDGTQGNDTINALAGNDTLRGLAGDDILNAGDGTDTINGGAGDDTITGGETEADRRDTIFGGAGNDLIDAGYGNDLVYGQDGNDTIAGGFGADELFGQNGNDVITGSAFSDLVFGGDGDDFVNGGFGFDRINGGAGADRFFHAAAAGHGSDWLQDYTAAEGDVLVFGGTGARASDFVVRFAHTATPAGERSGDDDVQEAFVNFRGETPWALVGGGGGAGINPQIGGGGFALLACP
ncbi:calcium-binding protein, partial [Aestuariivita sp.]|uniref:calcium-binding protein n=1 Tax=Aestuariivita sp. TaxID=1872407 RepID=UPI0025C19D34